MNLPETGDGSTEEHAALLMDSYRRWTGEALIACDSERSAREQLFHAGKVVLSHGTEDNPVLNYGNRLGLELWEMDWERFTDTPSRLTAEPMERAERDRFFRAVTESGYVDNYTGIRISSTGRRFYIVNATVWNVIDRDGAYKGQAAAFTEYRYL
ncbi:MEKHLA domain-containing protein [Paenibacillus arenilitoris]|uniref:MEKHLA domain-containing protein n=1 Tax=Paenibacillus arenilitoris TaxID=2772299 RepID=A0A927CKS6_9BACL|nr:MEKHLA domain-containing protein [Paenibacillus arenilitoris]MBD2869364.1 MEKHLA domain-containing protein [Paenibacillus arenilitoris]